MKADKPASRSSKTLSTLSLICIGAAAVYGVGMFIILHFGIFSSHLGTTFIASDAYLLGALLGAAIVLKLFSVDWKTILAEEDAIAVSTKSSTTDTVPAE